MLFKKLIDNKKTLNLAKPQIASFNNKILWRISIENLSLFSFFYC